MNIPTQTMKQEESSRRRAARLDYLLDILEIQLQEKTFAKCRLEDVVAACEFSLMTVYKLLISRDTAIFMLATRTLKRWCDLMDIAIKSDLMPRYILLSTNVSHYIITNTYPMGTACLFSSNTFRYEALVNEDILKAFDNEIARAIKCLETIVSLGIKSTDLKLDCGLNANDIATNIWSGLYGTMVLNLNNTDQTPARIHSYKLIVRRQLDDLNWKPLSSEINYDEESKNIINTLYAEEFKKIPIKQAPTYLN
ncbi:hypothetical protein [Methylotenera sp.]|uniref:hypothetical protein n=1 Tax=Methylotenera sp. TaxID=2051956 RepID=UPI002488BDBD|nr:hypothetical protein [Methylotenera sp.]MDI1298630.1 hypothetical protein [Methylotenera sp.]